LEVELLFGPCHCGLDPQSPEQPCHCGLDPQSPEQPCHCGLDPQSQEVQSKVSHKIAGLRYASPAMTNNTHFKNIFKMEKFIKITSTAVPLPIENIDTDQIIPARFLKAISKEGLGENLFRDWRYDKNNNPVLSFVLNNSVNKGEILVTGKNFGCGSSREHAAWAIAGYGFKIVVSSFFADIFKNNAMNNFVLPVVVSEEFLEELFDSIDKNPNSTITVDLKNQVITNNFYKKSESFEINAYKKECFLNGIDDIDFLLKNKEIIEEYEKQCN